jgi:hypothetical protein
MVYYTMTKNELKTLREFKKLQKEVEKIEARERAREWALRHKKKIDRAKFGVFKTNGLNFNKSVNDPNSRLARVVNHIRQNGPTTRRDLNLMLGMDPSIESRGWGTYLVTLAVQGKVLTMYRVGKKVLYDLGVNAKSVV